MILSFIAYTMSRIISKTPLPINPFVWTNKLIKTTLNLPFNKNSKKYNSNLELKLV